MKNPPLVHVSLKVSPESEDAVSVLLENILGQPPSFYTDAETGIMTASIYLENKAWSKDAGNQIAAGLREIEQCGLAVVSRTFSVRKVRREDWAESWKRHFKPIEVGQSLLIKPSWSRRKPKKGQVIVILDPGLSFGTGQHATTSFCLKQVARFRRSASGHPASFLDIGTGSGILAISAAKLGYQPVEAFDFDPESVRVSRGNARVNGVEKRLQISQRDLCQLPLRSGKQFDLVCANLIYDLLLAQGEKIGSRVSASGNLVLAGILEQQFKRVQVRYRELGFELKATRVEKEWQSGLFQRRT